MRHLPLVPLFLVIAGCSSGGTSSGSSAQGGGGSAISGGGCSGSVSGDMIGTFKCTDVTYQHVAGFYSLQIGSKGGTVSAGSTLSSYTGAVTVTGSGLAVKSYTDGDLDVSSTFSAVSTASKSYGGFAGPGSKTPVQVKLTITSLDAPNSAGPVTNTHGTLDATLHEIAAGGVPGPGQVVVHIDF